MELTFDFILDLSDPADGEDHGDGVAEPTGVDRYSQVADDENVILMRLKVPKVRLHGQIVAEVHQTVARGDDDCADTHVKEN